MFPSLSKERKAEYYQENKESINKRVKERREANIEENRAKERERYRQRRIRNGQKVRELTLENHRSSRVRKPAEYLCRVARARAKKQNIIFTICPEDIKVPSCCPILGFELCFTNSSPEFNSPSLDRIIPELGYVPGNIQVISWRANRLKSDASLEELKKLVCHLDSLSS